MSTGTQTPSRAQPPAGLEAVEARQHHVEHDRVVVGRGDHAQRLLAVGRDVDDQPLEAQAAADRGGHPHVVLDDEHPHAPIIAPRS